MDLYKFKAWNEKTKQLVDVVNISYKHNQIQVEIITKKETWLEIWDVTPEIILINSLGVYDKNSILLWIYDLIIGVDDPYSNEMPIIIHKRGLYYCLIYSTGMVVSNWNPPDYEKVGNYFKDKHLLVKKI